MLPVSNSALFGHPRRRQSARSAAPNWRRDFLLPAGWSRRTQFAIGWALLALVASTFLWSSTWLRPVKPVGIALVGAGYEQNLLVPHNVGGWQTLQQLAAVARADERSRHWGSGLLNLVHDPIDFYSCGGWDAGLDDVTERIVAVYFAVHGGADVDGPYLLPAGVGLQSAAIPLLRVRDVLDRLARLPADRHKILLLDATNIRACPELGLLENGFSQGLIDLDRQIADIPNLVVLCASGVGQRSWFCEEWRESVFGHYILQGFQGAAQDLNDDGRIDLAEFFRFVQGSVERWVQANREATQRPFLLPAGEIGLKRAARIDLALASQNYTPPDPRDTPVFEVPRKLAAHWEAHDRLAAETPAPWIYTPRLWRRYEDTLLRYEELLRIHETSTAEVLADQLDELALEMAQLRRLSLGSLQNSLAMPAAAGWSRALDGRIIANGGKPLDPTAVFNDLWRASPTELPACWSAIRARLTGHIVAEQTLVYLLREQILQRAADDFAAHGQKASQLLTAIEDPLSVRPAEVHFLIMLARDLPRPCSRNLSDLVRSALQVRRLAERAALGVQPGRHPYSEKVGMWIRDTIAAADRCRRAGEDRLFGEEAEWPAARRDFELAKACYLQAQQTAATLAAAWDLRDRLAASLPYYSRWLARRTSRDAVGRDRNEALFEQIEKLWSAAHGLTILLNRPVKQQKFGELLFAAAAAPALSPELTEIAACSTPARQSLAALEAAFVESLRDLVDVDLPSVWRDASDALLVPYCDSSLRMKLLTNTQRMSRRRLIETSQHAGTMTLTPQTVDIGDLKLHAARFGRLSMAELGPAWFDDCPGTGLETFEQVHHRLELLAVENAWQNSLNQAGWQIGRRWQEMGATMHALLEKGQGDEADAVPSLFEANILARQLPGAAVNPLAKDPCQVFRIRLMAVLLELQAERTWQDHWFADDPNSEPYYRRAALRYLNDAQQLGLESATAADVRRRVAGPGELEFASLPRQQLTTEQRFSLTYRLQPVTGAVVPAGQPVGWIEVGDSLKLLAPSDGRHLLSAHSAVPVADVPAPAGGAKTSPAGGDESGPSFEIRCDLASPWLSDHEQHPPRQPELDKSSLSAKALFRGQRISRATAVDSYAPADRTYTWGPLPLRGNIAIRAPESVQTEFGDGNGSVVIVLDASGSMGPAANQPFSPQTKYAEATQALRTVLERLPRGATVSLWVFGQASGAGKTVAAPELTIRQMQAPIRWDGSPAAVNAVMSSVEYPAIEPWNESPIMAALLAAKGDLAAAKGFKTIVLITDGMDNRFAADKQHNPRGWDVPTALHEAFDNTGIVVNIIGFKLVPAEEKIARAQFQPIERLSPPGALYTVSEKEGLVAVLETGLRQRLRYWIEDADNRLAPGIPSAGIGVSRVGANDQWLADGLAPGWYTINAHAGRLISKDLLVNRGDLLLAELVRRGDLLEFQRVLFSAADYPWKPARTQAGWRLSALQNQLVGGQGLQMLVGFEKLPAAAEIVLAQPRPRQIWMELSPRTNDAPAVAVRWREQAGYPAPTWKLAADRWPAPAKSGLPAPPRLQVWWNPDQWMPLATCLDRGPDFKNISDLAGQVITVHEQPIRVEGVSVEEHFVETAPGRLEQKSCLVVRVQHEAGRPVWVEVDGLALQGSEHRYFTAVGKYTGLFWSADGAQAEKALNKLRFYALDDFQRDAERRGYYLDADDLPPPQATDRPPRPLIHPE